MRSKIIQTSKFVTKVIQLSGDNQLCPNHLLYGVELFPQRSGCSSSVLCNFTPQEANPCVMGNNSSSTSCKTPLCGTIPDKKARAHRNRPFQRDWRPGKKGGWLDRLMASCLSGKYGFLPGLQPAPGRLSHMREWIQT